jgi:hypothetical protein
MRPLKLLHKFLMKELHFVHKKRLATIEACCEALIKGNTLSLTHLGRNMTSEAKEGSNIERVSRFLGNPHLHAEIPLFYRVINHFLIEKGSSPWVHIDWSCLSSTTQLYVLRATLSMRGRSFTLYQEVHPKKKENNHETHVRFLSTLKNLLPDDVKPVIVTDAGFKGPWFLAVLSMGWDYVGRLRGQISMDIGFTGDWLLGETYYEKATTTPIYLGQGLLTQANEIDCHFICYKESKKARVKLNKNKKKCMGGHSQKHAKANREPWMLATSLPYSKLLAEQAVKIYKQRMQIEETFRDTKNNRYGFGLCESGTKSAERMGVLLLIDFIVTFVCWQSGLLTVENKMASDFQAQSSKCKNILSIVYLGKQAIKKKINMTTRQFLRMIDYMKKLACSEPEMVC